MPSAVRLTTSAPRCLCPRQQSVTTVPARPTASQRTAQQVATTWQKYARVSCGREGQRRQGRQQDSQHTATCSSVRCLPPFDTSDSQPQRIPSTTSSVQQSGNLAPPDIQFFCHFYAALYPLHFMAFTLSCNCRRVGGSSPECASQHPGCDHSHRHCAGARWGRAGAHAANL